MSSTVTIFVTSLDTRSERRFDRHTTIAQLKGKLELITGIPTVNQRLELRDSDDATGTSKVVLSEDERPLGYYSVRDLQTLDVIDTNPSTSLTGQLHDTAGVEKFDLTPEEYARRQDSVLVFKQQHKLGRFAEKSDSSPAPLVPAVTAPIPVGSRCELHSTEPGLLKRGTVRFVGPTEFNKGGNWVGVELDEPMGKNDGSVQDVRYFTCLRNYGVFVRPDKVTVGDFPVVEINFDEEEEM